MKILKLEELKDGFYWIRRLKGGSKPELLNWTPCRIAGGAVFTTLSLNPIQVTGYLKEGYDFASMSGPPQEESGCDDGVIKCPAWWIGDNPFHSHLCRFGADEPHDQHECQCGAIMGAVPA